MRGLDNFKSYKRTWRQQKWGSYGGKRSRGKQREKLLDGLKKSLKLGRVTGALKASRDRDTWKVMITYAKEHGT